MFSRLKYGIIFVSYQVNNKTNYLKQINYDVTNLKWRDLFLYDDFKKWFPLRRNVAIPPVIGCDVVTSSLSKGSDDAVDAMVLPLTPPVGPPAVPLDSPPITSWISFSWKKEEKFYENFEISWWRSSIKNYYLIWVIWSDDHKTTFNNFITSSQTRHHKFINNKFALVLDAWSVFFDRKFFSAKCWLVTFIFCL